MAAWLQCYINLSSLPMIKGVIYSFTNYKGYGSYDVVGWRNYVDLFTDARVGKSYLFRSEEHTSELQSPAMISYAVFCLKKSS